MTRGAAAALVLAAACGKSAPRVAVVRSHLPGQRYHLHYERQSEGNTRVIDGLATVSAWTANRTTFAVVVDITSSGTQIAKGASYTVTVDTPGPGPVVEAMPAGDPKLPELYSLALEIMLGARCPPPVDFHSVGDSWVTRPEVRWTFEALDADTARYHVVDSTPDLGEAMDLRLALRDGYTGSCTISGAPRGPEHYPETMKLVVTPDPAQP